MDLFDLQATIRLDTKEYEQAVKGASADGQQLAKSWSGFGQKISAAFSVLGKAAVAGAGAVTAAVGVLTKSSLDAYSSFEPLALLRRGLFENDRKEARGPWIFTFASA